MTRGVPGMVVGLARILALADCAPKYPRSQDLHGTLIAKRPDGDLVLFLFPVRPDLMKGLSIDSLMGPHEDGLFTLATRNHRKVIGGTYSYGPAIEGYDFAGQDDESYLDLYVSDSSKRFSPLLFGTAKFNSSGVVELRMRSKRGTDSMVFTKSDD